MHSVRCMSKLIGLFGADADAVAVSTEYIINLDLFIFFSASQPLTRIENSIDAIRWWNLHRVERVGCENAQQVNNGKCASSDFAAKQTASVQRNLVSVPQRFSLARPYRTHSLTATVQCFPSTFDDIKTASNAIETQISFEYIDDDDRARWTVFCTQ